MDRLKALFRDARDKLLDFETLIDQYTRIEGRPVDEVLEEMEARTTMVKLLPAVFAILDENDRKILERYIIDGWTEFSIGTQLGMSQQAVSDRLRKIPSKVEKKLAKIACELGKYTLDIEDISIELGIPFRHTSTSPGGYPSDLLKQVSRPGYWRYKKTKMFISRTECKLPKYFTEAFRDDKTICSMCEGGKKCRHSQKN